MKKLKKTLRRAEALKKPSYDRPIIVTVDTSPTGIGWVINQADSDGARYPLRFGAKVLNKRQRGYAQVKRELRGIVSAIKARSGTRTNRTRMTWIATTIGSKQMAIRRTRDMRGLVFSSKGLFWRISVDARLGGGGCRGENRPLAESVDNVCESALTHGHKFCCIVHS